MRFASSIICALVCSVSTCSAGATLAQEWSRFRGPNGSGESEAALPTSWNSNDYAWQVALPGIGHSSPVVWGDKIFLTSAEDAGRKRWLMCLSLRAGGTLWKRDFPSENYHIHQQNSFATSTPAVDAEQVYLLDVTPEHYWVRALDHSGKPLWKVDLGPFVSQHGFGTSPILYDGMLIANNDQDGVSFLFALDCRDGKERWRSPRKSAVVAYSTPCVYQPPGADAQLIFNSEAHGITSIDPKNGKLLWELPAFDKRSVSSPLVASGLVFGSCGSGGGGNYVVGVRPGKTPEIAVRFDKQAPYVPTSVARGDLLFMWGDNGIVTCAALPSGETKWQKRVGGNFSSSPVRAGDAIYCVSVEGEVVVLAAKDEFQELGRIPLGEVCRATPAIAAGRLLIRTQSHLYAIGSK